MFARSNEGISLYCDITVYALELVFSGRHAVLYCGRSDFDTGHESLQNRSLRISQFVSELMGNYRLHRSS